MNPNLRRCDCGRMPLFKATNSFNSEKYAAQVRCQCGTLTNSYGYSEDLFKVCQAAIDAWNNREELIYSREV